MYRYSFEPQKDRPRATFEVAHRCRLPVTKQSSMKVFYQLNGAMVIYYWAPIFRKGWLRPYGS